MTASIIKSQLRLLYGAAELKRNASRTTAIAFSITIILFAAIIIAYLANFRPAADDGNWHGRLPKIIPPVKPWEVLRGAGVKSGTLKEGKKMLILYPPPPPLTPGQAVAGYPVARDEKGESGRQHTETPVVSSVLGEDLIDGLTQNFGEIESAGLRDFNFGPGINNDDLSPAKTQPQRVEDDGLSSVVDPYHFVPHEVLPYTDLSDLQRRVVYPAIALRSGLEGTVQIRVLIDQDGKIIQYLVESAEYEVFVEPAVEALKQSVFSPARQNKLPITCWVSIPIKFSLH